MGTTETQQHVRPHIRHIYRGREDPCTRPGLQAGSPPDVSLPGAAWRDRGPPRAIRRG
jgi:hypothetical protein